MRKVIRVIFSRLTLVGLIFIAQLALLIWVIVTFSTDSIWFLASGYFISALVVIGIVYKDEIPEFKLPWIIIVLVLPGVGALIYWLFGHLKLEKKVRKKFLIEKSHASEYLAESEESKKLYKDDKEASLQFNYIYKACYQTFYVGTRTKYFPLGDFFFPDLLLELSKAEKFIFMEYFIIKKGQMWDKILDILEAKVKQGVEVKLMYDDMGCMFTLPSDYYRKMIGIGIECVPFNRFRPVLTSMFNNRDHRKITVIDGRVGYTGGINLSDEYININSPYGHWKDSAIKLAGPGVRGLLEMFILNWNGISHKPLDFKKYLCCASGPAADVKGGVAPFGDGPDPIYKEKVGKTVYLNIINSAKEYIYITTPYLICDYELLNALAISAKKGVDVRIITPHIPDKKMVFDCTRSNYPFLMESGVKIYEYTAGFIHAKNFLADDKFAVVGTINMDYRSLVHHFECGVFMYKTDSIMELKDDFNNLFKSQVTHIDEFSAKLNTAQLLGVKLIKAFFPLL